MTKVEVTTNPDGHIKIEANGHTQSIVCASVSTLLQSTVRFLQDLSKQYPDDLQVIISQQEREKSRLCVKVDATGLDIFQDLLDFLKNIVNDQRIPINLREEFMDNFNKMVEQI